VAHKVLDVLSQPVRRGDADLMPGASIGVSRFPIHGETAIELIAAADQAMYRAKLGGRGRVCLAGDGGENGGVVETASMTASRGRSVLRREKCQVGSVGRCAISAASLRGIQGFVGLGIEGFRGASADHRATGRYAHRHRDRQLPAFAGPARPAPR
jgi:hypothetical protein